MPLKIFAGCIIGFIFLAQTAYAFAAGGLALQQHQNQLMRQQPGVDAPTPGPKTRELAQASKMTPQMRAEIDRLRRVHMRRLAPEYNHRVKTEGRKAADLWLQREATRLGRRAALDLRRKHRRP